MLQSAIYRSLYLGITFIVGVLLANILGPSNFGSYSLLIMNASLLSLITGIGADSIVLHSLVNKKWTFGQSYTFTWMVIVGQLLILMLLQFIYFGITNQTLLSQQPVEFLLPEVLYFSGLVILEKILVLFYALNRARLINIMLAVVSFLFMGLLFWVRQKSILDYKEAIELIASVSMLQALLALLFFHINVHKVSFEKLDRQSWFSAVKSSFTVMITNVVQLFAYRIDFWLIAFFYTNREVGIFAQANKLANLMWIVPNIFALLLIPKFSQLKEKELQPVFRLAFLSNIFLGVATIIAAVIFYRFFLHPAYSTGLHSFYLMLPGYFSWALVIYFGAYFSYAGWFKYNLIASACCLLTIFISDIILIPLYSIQGAAIANTIAYTATLFLYLYLYQAKKGGDLLSLLAFRLEDLKLLKRTIIEKG